MKKIYILGAGPGHPDYILNKTKALVKSVDLVVGSKRLINSFDCIKKFLLIKTDFNTLFNEVEKKLEDINSVAFIVSGDPELYSLTGLIQKRFKAMCKIEIVPGISSVTYFYSKLQRPLNGIPILSLHGRNFDLKELDSLNEFVILLGNKNCLKDLSEYFLNSNKEFILGENLSYENELITRGKPEDFLNYNQSTLSILSILDN